MIDPNFIILYVDNPLTSADFYAALLGKSPIEASPTFAMFALDSGAVLGLWSKHTVKPSTGTIGGGCEIAFSVKDRESVRTIHAEWKENALPILQPLTDMDFGYTFVATDPDGHRLRVFAVSS